MCIMCLFAMCGSAQDLTGFKSKQVCKEVCGVKFGSSYDTAKEILQKKYGSPDILLSDENDIVYSYKSYAGVQFSKIMFHFQRNNYNSYMNKCVMGIQCTTAQEAKERRDYIFSKVKEKYATWDEYTDDDGFKYYLGGISPLGGEIGSGFCVDIVKYDKPYDGYNYFARIMYGDYNYLNEEF